MVEFDYVIPPEITISYEGDLDLRELYNLVKSWLNDRGFFIIEKGHEGSLENFKSKWDAEKKVDDYTKYVIKVTLKANKLKQISIKNKNLYSGEFSVAFESFLEKDYEEKWEKKPFLKLFRSLYNKFVEKSQEEHHEKELKELTKAFYNEVKAYFGLKSKLE